MPTWRKYLTSDSLDNSGDRGKVSEFFDSVYAKNWMSLLHSVELERVASKHGAKVIFAPHPNMGMYIQDMKLPPYIEAFDMRGKTSYQDLILRARVALTCFSSAAMEVAYLQRPVVYFQFDAEAIFSGNHVSRLGGFSFEDHGFGPVASRANDAIAKVDLALSGGESYIYSERRNNSFPLRDGRCCERIVNRLDSLNDWGKLRTMN